MFSLQLLFFFLVSSLAVTIKESFWEENCFGHWVPAQNEFCLDYEWNETCTPWNTSYCHYELAKRPMCRKFDCQVITQKICYIITFTKIFAFIYKVNYFVT